MKTRQTRTGFFSMRWLVAGILVVGLAGMAGCDPDNENQIFIPIRQPTAAPTKAPTAKPTATSKPTATPKPTPTPSPAGTATPSPTPTLAPEACVPSSSLGVLVQGTNATIYAPQGNWDGGTAAVKVVPIETSAGVGKGGPSTTITTPNVTNSCSCNSTTGTTVCVANNTDVYIINGTTLTKTLTSGATGTTGFSGGFCTNCGVVVDSSTNTAELAMGLSSSPSGSGYQTLDLATNTFAPPVDSPTGVSEDIAVDPVRHLILSPNERGNYEIVQTTPTSTVFQNQIGPIPTPTPVGAPLVSSSLDSAGEDCTTGIALSTDEGTGNLFIADLTKATFTPGTPNTWTAPSQFMNFPEFNSLSAGTSGIAVAPGSHLAIVTGEFGGALEGVVQLPSTSGSGAPPAITDWVAFTMPNTPSGGFSMGFDPHTVTAYVSPNSAKAFGVLEDSSFTFLAVVDLDGLLKAKRTAPGSHTVDPSVDLIATGLVIYIAE